MNSRTIFLFRRYIKNECSAAELDELLETLKKDRDVGQLEIITNTLWQAIHKRPQKRPVGIEKRNWEEEAGQLISRAGFQKSRHMFTTKSIYHRAVSIAAAAAVVAILIVGAMQLAHTSKNNLNGKELSQSSFQYFNADEQDMRQVILPDGTKVLLNKSTELRIIASQFNGKLREVWLFGEAFFEVTKNPGKPFVIHTGNMTTTVRGTSFNIKAYPQLSENVVSVKTGKVEISTQNAVLAMLTPGKQLIYHTSTGKSDMQEVNPGEIAAWSDGRLVLDNASVAELKLRIKQQFGVKLRINTQALENVRMNAVFDKKASLQNVMETIRELYGISYEITKSDNVIINN